MKDSAVWESIGGFEISFWVWTYTGTRTTLLMLAVVFVVLFFLAPFYDTVKESNPYFTGFAAMLDVFSAKRLTIAKFFLDAVSFTPNGIEGFYIDSYYAGHAHNTYIQMAYQFGIPTAVFYISFFFYGFIDRFRAYKKNHEAYNLLPVLLLAMMLTTWITETVIICSSMTIMGLITMYPFVAKLDDEEMVATPVNEVNVGAQAAVDGEEIADADAGESWSDSKA